MRHLVCPQCGEEERFSNFASEKFAYGDVWVLFRHVRFSEDKWDAEWQANGEGREFEVNEEGSAICLGCGHEGHLSEFGYFDALS